MVTVESQRHGAGVVHHDINGTKLVNRPRGKLLKFEIAGDIRSLRDTLPPASVMFVMVSSSPSSLMSAQTTLAPSAAHFWLIS